MGKIWQCRRDAIVCLFAVLAADETEFYKHFFTMGCSNINYIGMTRIFLFLVILVLLLACGGTAIYGNYRSVMARDSVVDGVLRSVTSLHVTYSVVEVDGEMKDSLIEFSYDYTTENGDSAVWVEGMFRLPL